MHINGIDIVSIEKIELNDNMLYLFFKRILDIFASFIGLILLSPIFIIVAIAIKLENPKGNVFFYQERCGKDNKLFKMYKFRSMIINAEDLLEELKEMNEMDGPVFKIKEDPRITKVGKFIRKTSIDELPQLLNILKGEMSLVGPRPAIPHEVEEYNEYQKQRLLVKPGLTCIWQVSGRNTINFDEWIEMDLEYIKTRSFFIDLKLIFKTIGVLFGDENAA